MRITITCISQAWLLTHTFLISSSSISYIIIVFIIVIGNPIKPVECTTVNYTLVATKDVWLERENTDYNYKNFLIIGKHAGYPKKRSILQFQDLPSSCTNVISAKMYIWYWLSYKSSWLSDAQAPHLSHVLKAHQIKKDWVETEVTRSYRKSGISWSQKYLGLDGTDANATPLDSVEFPNPPPSGDDRWIEFNITSAAQNWANGQPNYGVVIWSNREDEDGRGLRFYSRERSFNRPYVIVSCSTNMKPQPSIVVMTGSDYTSHAESNGFNAFSAVQSDSPSVFNYIEYKGNTTMEITVSSNYGNTVTTYNKKVPSVVSTVSSTTDTPTNSMYTGSSYSSSVFGDEDVSISTSVIQMILPFPNSSTSPSIIGVIVGCICAGVFALIILTSIIGCIILHTRYSVYSSHCTCVTINSPKNISPSTTMNQVYGITINNDPLPSVKWPHIEEEPKQQKNICYGSVKHQDYHNGGSAGDFIPQYEEIYTIPYV